MQWSLRLWMPCHNANVYNGVLSRQDRLPLDPHPSFELRAPGCSIFDGPWGVFPCSINCVVAYGCVHQRQSFMANKKPFRYVPSLCLMYLYYLCNLSLGVIQLDWIRFHDPNKFRLACRHKNSKHWMGSNEMARFGPTKREIRSLCKSYLHHHHHRWSGQSEHSKKQRWRMRV